MVSSGTKLPSGVMFSNFRKLFQAVVETEEFIAFEEYLERFFSRLCSPYECSIPLFFSAIFAVLRTSCSLVDPDARLGYYAAKKQKFLGYRVQLLNDDKKKIPLKIEVTPANTHDSKTLLPIIDKIIAEHPQTHIGNLNADNGYLSDDNPDGLNERRIDNSVVPRKKSSRKIPKKRQNQRKCIKVIFGIIVQCLGLQNTRVRGLPNVAKDTYLKFIALMP